MSMCGRHIDVVADPGGHRLGTDAHSPVHALDVDSERVGFNRPVHLRSSTFIECFAYSHRALFALIFGR